MQRKSGCDQSATESESRAQGTTEHQRSSVNAPGAYVTSFRQCKP